MNYTKGEWLNMGGAIECKIGDSAYKRIAHAAPMVEKDQYEANANLIAAAPAMYEALQEICRTYRIEPDSKPDNWDARGLTGWAVVLKALAKAEGGGSPDLEFNHEIHDKHG